MPGLYLKTIPLNSILSQDPSISQRIQKNKPLSFLLRVLGSGMFFLALLFFPILAFSADVTLAWDPNSEADLEGYGVYFKLGASGPPYDLFGYVTLQELSDPDNPAFAVTGLVKGSSYYFAVTAYDTAGNESSYSAPVCAQIGDQILPCTSPPPGSGGGSSGSGGSSGGGGGGGGCFIETSLDHFQPYAMIFALLFLGAVFFLWCRMFSLRNFK